MLIKAERTGRKTFGDKSAPAVDPWPNIKGPSNG